MEKQLSLYQKMADNMPGVLFQSEINARGSFQFNFICEHVEKIIGIHAEDIKAEPAVLYRFVDEDGKSEAIEAAKRAIRLHTDICLEIKRKAEPPEYSEKWYLVRATPRFYPDGRSVWDGLAVDVTREKENELKLEKASNYLSKILDSLEEAIFIVEPPQRKITQVCNGTVEGILGYSRDELIGRPPKSSMSTGRCSKNSEKWGNRSWNPRGYFEPSTGCAAKTGQSLTLIIP